MSILCNEDTRLMVQGITGRNGRFHTKQCLEYGTRIVAGVSPGKGGAQVEGVPVFNTVHQAVQAADANASLIFVPAPGGADAIMEAADEGVELVVCITEGIPASDMVKVKRFMEDRASRLIGPNCPGVITPAAKCKIGIMPGFIHRPGSVGVISRSGTLTYETVDQLSRLGIGQSTCIGIGGDPVVGTTHTDALRMFGSDPDTEAVLMIGEIGGTAEEEAADFAREHMDKPVAAFIAGRTAPPRRRMGHAGAIISGGVGTAQGKIDYLRSAGITVAESPADIGEAVASII